MTTFDDARNARLAAARELAVYRSLANDLHAEWKAFDEAVESKAIRYVKTPKGAEFYNQPVGSPIRPGGGKLNYIRNGPKKKRASASASNVSSATTPEKETPSKPRIDYTRRAPKASASETPAASSKPAAPSVPVDKTTLPVNRLTDSDIKKQADELTNSKRKLSGAEQTRLNQLVAEEKRRENLAGTGSPNSFSAAGLDKEISKLEKTKRRTPEQNRRLLELRLAQSRQRYALNRTQDQLMAGRKSDSVETARFTTDVKVYDAVGDGDWDCSHMTDDDLDWFLGKTLAGHPTVEKLQQANAMLTEKLARVETTEPEVKELTWEPETKDAMHDPKGGLSAEGRAHFKAQGSNLKPGVTKYDEASDADKRRWVRWCLRFAKTPRPLKDDKGEPTNYALMFRAWGRPVPQTADDVRATYNLGLKRRDTLGMGDGKKDDADEFADWDSALS